MNKKEALDKIRAIFSSEEKLEEVAPVETLATEEEVIEVTFVEVKTEDGKILRVDDIAVTSTVVAAPLSAKKLNVPDKVCATLS